MNAGVSDSIKPLAEERRRLIVDLVQREGRIMVADLVRRFGVSAVTARNDLDLLANVGAIFRTHGGAVRSGDPAQEVPLHVKESMNHPQKVRIGQSAARLVQPMQTIILDSGSTTLHIARALKKENRSGTVITDALNIAVELADAPHITLIMLGGVLRQLSKSFVGPQAERMLSELHADHLFLGADAFDPEQGPSTPDILEAQLNSLMIRVAVEVTVVADSSKLGQRSMSLISDVRSVHRLITDDEIRPELREAFEAQGVTVITA